MFDTFFGLPLHPLVVHATEVIVPLRGRVFADGPAISRWVSASSHLPSCRYPPNPVKSWKRASGRTR